jgi:transposase
VSVFPRAPIAPRSAAAAGGETVCEVAPRLYGMSGCGAVTASKIMGETALVTRFSGEAAFAQHAGLAPVPHWSGRTAGRMRRPKYGNRQLNSAVHRIAVTQLRCTARDGTITTNDLRLATPVQWHFGHSNDGRAVYGHLREDHRCRQPGNGRSTPPDSA